MACSTVCVLALDALKETGALLFWLALFCPSAHGLYTDTYWHGLYELPTLTAFNGSILTEIQPHK